jgi:PhnB protein
MPKRSLTKIEQLNRAVNAMVARTDGKAPGVDASVEPLVRMAAELRDLPRESFKERLLAEFKGRKQMSAIAEPIAAVQQVLAPYLALKNASQAIEFYKKAFGAKETMRLTQPDGRIGHAEIEIGGAKIMLSDEFPDYGSLSPQTLGGSPTKIHLYVEDVDAVAKRAVAAGAKIIRPIEDQFYGDRSGQIADPFGYTWIISTHKESVSTEEVQRRLEALYKPSETKKTEAGPPRGFRTLTTYLVAQDADSVVNFMKQTFGAQETMRAGPGSEGGMHCEVRIGDSMLMIGGGGSGFAWRGAAKIGAFHVYVRDCDATYQRALDAGAVSIAEPADQFYGERSAGVKDAAGNHWYIATYKGENYKWEGAPDVQPYLHPLRAEPVINFLKRAFGAEELGRYTSPDGVIHHTTLKIGSSHMEMGEAQGIYQPMASMFYLYVPDVDAMYQRALAAGATSISEPGDQPYGDRVGAVSDVFGNQWYIGTHVKDV